MIGRTTILAAMSIAVAVAGGCGDDEAAAGACGAEDPEAVPNDLACTGLYSDFATKTIARFLAPFCSPQPLILLPNDRAFCLCDAETLSVRIVASTRRPSRQI